MRKFKIKCDKTRVAESVERIRVVASGGIPDRVPLLFFDVIPAKADPPWPQYDLFDDEKDLEFWVAKRNLTLERFPEGDFFPWLWAGTPFGQAVVPSLFGAKVVIDGCNHANIEDRLIRNLETDLDKLPRRIDPEKDGLGPRLRRRLKHWVEATDGQVSIFPFDWQSPYGVACMLMSNEDLMVAMYDTPELVRELFDRVTQAIIDLLHAAQSWIGNPDLCMLNNQMFFKGSGMTLHDDYISVLSPSLHQQFCMPCNIRLYETFGYGHLHTCGPLFPGYVDAMLAHKGILSFDISKYLRGQTRTRKDLIEFKRLCRTARVTLTGTPTTCVQINQSPVIPADWDLFNQMAEGGGLIMNWASGTREEGLKLLRWGAECYR